MLRPKIEKFRGELKGGLSHERIKAVKNGYFLQFLMRNRTIRAAIIAITAQTT